MVASNTIDRTRARQVLQLFFTVVIVFSCSFKLSFLIIIIIIIIIFARFVLPQKRAQTATSQPDE